MKIDLHTHILPKQWPDLAQRYGYGGFVSLDHIANGGGGCCKAHMVVDGKVFRTIGDNTWDPAVRLRECDTHGVNVQVLSTVPIMFSYWARPEHTLDLSRLLNDHLAQVCRDHPNRFVGLGMLPMNDPDMAARELERCVNDLGLAGAQIGTNVNGANLGEPQFLPVFTAAQDLDACIFVHPWDMLGATWNKSSILPVPPGTNPRYAKYWLAWLVGMPAETCMALCSVLFSGLLDKLPRLRIGFAHGGGSFLGTIGRIEHGFAARPDLCQTDTTRPLRSHLHVPGTAGIYVDSLVHDADALRALIRLFGAGRVALGSDYPFPLGEDLPGALIDSLTDLPPIARAQLLYGTALHFLGPAAAHLRPLFPPTL